MSKTLALDPATFLLALSIFCLMMSAIAHISSSTFGGGEVSAGLREWSRAMLAAGASMVLFFLRGTLPDALTVLLPNALALAATALGLLAHARFFGAAVPLRDAVVLCAVALTGLGGAYALDLSRSVIVLSISAPIAVMLLMLAALIINNAHWKEEPSTWMSLGSILLLAVALVVRCVIVLVTDGASAALYAQSAPQFGFLVAGALCMLSTSMGFILMAHERHRRNIVENARRDGLTGLYTRSAFFEIAAALDAAGTPYSVVMADIDFFKKINDTYGHAAGDVALVHAARLIANSIRGTDTAGRYGGEEFCVLLRECGRDDAAQFANRLVEAASRQRIRLPAGDEIGLTISAGYAWCQDQGTHAIKDLLETADHALYQAKRNGRNQALPAA